MNRFAKRNIAKNLECEMRCVSIQLNQLQIQRKGWKALGPGIKTAYADGQCARELARKTGFAEDFHKWRKRTKELWYQVTLLRRIWPEQLDAILRDLEILEENQAVLQLFARLKQHYDEIGSFSEFGADQSAMLKDSVGKCYGILRL